MTDPTRGVRQRRSSRRPGWPLLTALLVLAIVASSALVFTNQVQLLKLAVIIALWAAVVAAFISFIYRRQADVDQAKVRDLKLVYDLQLDREISARREYELSVESHLRRELSSELRAQASDEVAALRAELAALRANLEVLFDTDLQDRPALETERTAIHTFGRVISSRIDAERIDDPEPNTDESPIIDVPEEPQPADYGWTPPPAAGGAHRRASERDAAANGWRPAEPPPARTPTPDASPPWLAPEPAPRRAAAPAPEPAPRPAPDPAPRPAAWPRPSAPPPERRPAAAVPDWQPVSAEGSFVPAGDPGSNWISPAAENGSSVPPAPAPAPPTPAPNPAPAPAPPTPAPAPAPPTPVVAPPPTPAMAPSPAEPRRARHSSPDVDAVAERGRSRHSASDAPDPGRPSPTLAAPPQPAAPPPPSPVPSPPAPPPEPVMPPTAPRRSRHRSADDPEPPAGQHAGGQPLSELLARLQTSTTGEGGRRRRRDD